MWFWRDDTPGNFEVFYKKSTDGGISWTANKRLTWTPGGSYGRPLPPVFPGVSMWSGGTKRPGTGKSIIRKRRWGETWSNRQKAHSDLWRFCRSRIAVDTSGDLHVVLVMSDSGVGAHIDYMKSADGGKHLDTAQRLSWGSGLPSLPVIVIDPTITSCGLVCDDTRQL